jgi:ribosomal protein S13
MAKAKAICDQIEYLFYELTQISVQLSEEEISKIQKIIEERNLLLKIKLLKRELEQSEV